MRIDWICSKGLGTNLGHGEVRIGVPVWCYMECNRARSEDGFGVPDVLVLPVLDPEVPDFLPPLPFLFAVVWA